MLRIFSLATFLLIPALRAEPLAVTAPPFFQPKEGDTVVFLGDSITHQCLYTQYIEDFFYTRYPDRKIRIHNAGVSGDKAGDALARFEDDVAAFAPDFVTILLGMNDGQYEPYNEKTFATYQDGMTRIADRIEELGAQTIALSPTMFDHHQLALRKKDPEFRFGDRAFFEEYNALMGYYSGWLREISNQRKTPFVNLWGALNDFSSAARLTEPDFSLVEDAIHPGAAGQFIMAFEILVASQPERRTVSSISISERNGQWIAPKNSGISGKIDSSKDGTLTFTHLASALPWVVPDESSEYDLKWGESLPASVGYTLTKAGHKLSAERFRVQGLAPGKYELSIDDQAIATFTHAALARGVELQNHAGTPQSQQALEVALLNREKNDKAVRPMRDLWARVKGLRRKGDSDAFGNEYPKLKEKIDALNHSAREFETRIYAKAQPIPRKYQLNRIGAE